MNPADNLSGGGLSARLSAAGLHPHLLTPTLFLSIPESAAIMLDDGRSIDASPATLARSTADSPLQAPLRFVDDIERDEVAGTIGLLNGPLTPESVYSLERRGALAQIYMDQDGKAQARSCSTIWGSPTHESVARHPRTPVVMVGDREGEILRQVAAASACVRLTVNVREAWQPTRLPVVEIHGAHDPDEFILVHGSDDETLLALAQDLHARRGALARSVRIAWWPDRALGSAAGSTWYADEFAGDLDEWCVAHVSVGGRTDGDAYWMPEAAELCLEALAAAGHPPLKGRRPPRDANYSFNQIGVSGMFGGRALPPAVYTSAVVRLATAAIYPLDYTAAVLEMGAALQRYQAAAGNELDFRGVLQELARLRRAIAGWRSDVETDLRRHPADASLRRGLNLTMRRLARVLVPLGFARGERFDHDPAVRFSAVPRLEAALHVAESVEPMRSFVRTALVRERNKILAATRDALMLLR